MPFTRTAGARPRANSRVSPASPALAVAYAALLPPPPKAEDADEPETLADDGAPDAGAQQDEQARGLRRNGPALLEGTWPHAQSIDDPSKPDASLQAIERALAVPRPLIPGG